MVRGDVLKDLVVCSNFVLLFYGLLALKVCETLASIKRMGFDLT
jgi:hypothetical protein